MRSEGSLAQPNLHVGVAFLLLRTCIRYLRERILYSVGTNTRRQAKLIVVLLTWLANAVGVLNECKSSRADSECRFSFFGEAKKSKCPVGTRRMVKATLKANHKAATHFQAALSCKQRQPENQNCQTNHAPKKIPHTQKAAQKRTKHIFRLPIYSLQSNPTSQTSPTPPRLAIPCLPKIPKTRRRPLRYS